MLVIHHGDADGQASAAIVVKYSGGAVTKCISINYGDPLPLRSETDGEDVVMVDFSMPPEEMDAIRKRAKSFVWIDHHISAIRNWKTYMGDTGAEDIDGIRVVGHAGLELTYLWYNPLLTLSTLEDGMPKALGYLGCYDIYRHFGNDSKWNDIMAFQLAYRAFSNDKIDPMNTDFWTPLIDTREKSPEIDVILSTGYIIKDYQAVQDAQYTSRQAFNLNWKGYTFLAMNRCGGSVMLDSMFDTDVHDGVLTFYWTNKKYWSCSIYSDKPYLDFSKIALEFGGGGHANACGWETESLPFSLFD